MFEKLSAIAIGLILLTGGGALVRYIYQERHGAKKAKKGYQSRHAYTADCHQWLWSDHLGKYIHSFLPRERSYA